MKPIDSKHFRGTGTAAAWSGSWLMVALVILVLTAAALLLSPPMAISA